MIGNPFIDFKKYKSFVRHFLFIVTVPWVLMLVLPEASLAQDDKKAERWFAWARENLARNEPEKAIELCERILERDSGYVDAYLLLADIYNRKVDVQNEISALEKAASLTDMPLLFYRLGEAYYAQGNYLNALPNYQKYLDGNPSQSQRFREVERKRESCIFAVEAMKNPVDFEPERLPDEVNSMFDEYWPCLTVDGQKLVITRRVKFSGQMPQEDFYISEFDSAGWSKAEALTELNTPFNEGAHSISADGKILFFTACNQRNGFGSCDIYYSFKENGKWSRPVNAGKTLNTSHWEAQPSIASDGRTIYFTSNRRGGKGKKDIWMARLKGRGKNGLLEWDEPVNLGGRINTPGNETSPFIHASKKTFYFASDYHTGMGNFDLFLAEISHDTVFSRPQNLGYPVNTFNDEQGIFVNTSGNTAYYSSKREKGSGLDIFSFQLDESIRPAPATYVHAQISNAMTNEPVQALIELVNLSSNENNIRKELTDKEGDVLLCLPAGSNYAFSVSKKGFLFYSDAFNLSNLHEFYNPYNLKIELMPIRVGAKMDLYNIYFETDSFRILPQSEPELMQLVRFLENNPDLEVEIQGHTDNTGNETNNLKLSNRRAKSVVDFLIKHGISRNRLNSRGYGESEPVASNNTKKGRRLNRRTTIKIL